MPNPYVNKVVQSNGTTLIDISDTTAVAADVAGGKYFYLATGEKVEGTASGGGSVTWELMADQDVIVVTSTPNYFVINNYTTPFSADETYRVTWDGTEYICQTKAIPEGTYDGYCIGNYALAVSGGENTGEPFFIYRDRATRIAAVTNYSAGTVHIKIERQTTSSATLITKTITANGTYSASSDGADGYSQVTVNVSTGGGSSSWTKVAETSYQVNTTSTSGTTVATWATGHSEIWTSDKWVYVRIRDTAGKRNGYFYGTDTFFANYSSKNNPSNTGVSESLGMLRNIYSVTTGGVYGWRYGYSTTGYGVYADYVYDDGRIRIQSRYNSSYSRTINGTYKVEVYLLDPPTGAPIFT